MPQSNAAFDTTQNLVEKIRKQVATHEPAAGFEYLFAAIFFPDSVGDSLFCEIADGPELIEFFKSIAAGESEEKVFYRFVHSDECRRLLEKMMRAAGVRGSHERGRVMTQLQRCLSKAITALAAGDRPAAPLVAPPIEANDDWTLVTIRGQEFNFTQPQGAVVKMLADGKRHTQKNIMQQLEGPGAGYDSVGKIFLKPKNKDGRDFWRRFVRSDRQGVIRLHLS